jgi:hypothetical protein
VTFFLDTVDPTRSYAIGKGLSGGIVGTSISFVIQMVDSYNNTIYTNASAPAIGNLRSFSDLPPTSR